jgi:endonuclease/exonuclease/phosphatase family metal-dependent hydrolase
MTTRRLRSPALLAALVLVATGCTTVRPRIVPAPPIEAACRAGVLTTGATVAPSIRWTAPPDAGDRLALDEWCRAVGPAVLTVPTQQDGDVPRRITDLVVVSWNVHVGAGDVVRLVETLRSGRWTDGRPVERFVLLLQETYRSGGMVPGAERSGRWAATVRPRLARPRLDAVELAEALGLSLYYVPSMRNGPPAQTDEDRGNAILSTEPLTDLEAIELPFERQRRVVVQATIPLDAAPGEPGEALRLTSAHFENLGPRRRLGIFSTASRREQAEALIDRLPARGPAVLGGDLNTWFGTLEPAYRRLAARFDPVTQADSRPTFGGVLRLDHLLVRLPAGWDARTIRLERFGSDHHPLLAHLRRSTAPQAGPASPW